jgi:hypothetical protein
MSTFSVPIPTDFIDANDRFTSIFLGAPDFQLLQKAVTYTITLDMMFDSLKSGVEGLARRCKKDESRQLYLRAIEELDIAYRYYVAGKDSHGCFHVQLGQCYLRQAGKPLSRPAELKKEEWLREKLHAMEDL